MRTKESNIFGKAIGRVLEKAGTSEGAKKGWETRKRGGATAPGESKQEVYRMADEAMKIRERPDVLAATKMGHDLFWGESKMPLREAFATARKRADEAQKLGEEALKRYGDRMDEHKADMIRWEIDAIKGSVRDTEQEIADAESEGEKGRKYAARGIAGIISGADSMSLWVSNALNYLKE